MRAQRRLRSDYASAQSDKSLRRALRLYVAKYSMRRRVDSDDCDQTVHADLSLRLAHMQTSKCCGPARMD